MVLRARSDVPHPCVLRRWVGQAISHTVQRAHTETERGGEGQREKKRDEEEMENRRERDTDVIPGSASEEMCGQKPLAIGVL